MRQLFFEFCVAHQTKNYHVAWQPRCRSDNFICFPSHSFAFDKTKISAGNGLHVDISQNQKNHLLFFTHGFSANTA